MMLADHTTKSAGHVGNLSSPKTAGLDGECLRYLALKPRQPAAAGRPRGGQQSVRKLPTRQFDYDEMQRSLSVVRLSDARKAARSEYDWRSVLANANDLAQDFLASDCEIPASVTQAIAAARKDLGL